MRRVFAEGARRMLIAGGLAACLPLVYGAGPTGAAVPAAPTAGIAGAAGSPGAATGPPGTVGPAAGAATIVQQPRPFGYVLGDTLTQRILLQSAGRYIEPAALPPAERAGLWFARRSSQIELAEDGRHWLVLDYQLVNAPQMLMTVNLPSVSIKSRTGGDALTVPEWPISVGPLTPRAAFAKGGLQELRPDHQAPLLPTLGLIRSLEISFGVFVLVVLSWAGWWLVRHFRAAGSQPFARALREIRRADEGNSAGWVAMHRAFDSTAGRTLQLSNLSVLFKHAPHFAPERAAIERFYAESNVRFFGVAPARRSDSAAPGEPSTGGESAARGQGAARGTPAAHGEAPDHGAPADPATSLRALCATLRGIEKRHER